MTDRQTETDKQTVHRESVFEKKDITNPTTSTSKAVSHCLLQYRSTPAAASFVLPSPLRHCQQPPFLLVSRFHFTSLPLPRRQPADSLLCAPRRRRRRRCRRCRRSSSSSLSPAVSPSPDPTRLDTPPPRLSCILLYYGLQSNGCYLNNNPPPPHHQLRSLLHLLIEESPDTQTCSTIGAFHFSECPVSPPPVSLSLIPPSLLTHYTTPHDKKLKK